MSNRAREVDVDLVLDAARFRGLPLLVMICAAVIMVLDGFDIQIIGFAAPALAAEFGIERSALAPALAASLIGMAIGAFSLGPWGDRHGRRTAVFVSTIVFGLGTLASAAATNLETLTVLRFLTGIGLGGALPNATALMAEFAPPRARGQAIAAAIVGVPIGGMLGAAIAAEIIPVFGWRAIFIIGGSLPMLAAVLIYFILPESPRYLATQPGKEPMLAAILNRVVGEARFDGTERYILASPPANEASGTRGVFAKEMLRDTMALWLMFITNVFSVYCFYNWAPVVLTSLGIDLATAVRGSLVFNSAGLIGSLSMSWVIARVGSRGPLTALGVVGALALLYVGRVVGAAETADASTVTQIMLGFAVAGFCILAVQTTLYSLSSHVYPTVCRSAGVGWAVGAARIGGVSSAFAGAMIMARAGASGFFTTITFVLGLTVVGVWMLRRQIPGMLASQPAQIAGERDVSAEKV